MTIGRYRIVDGLGAVHAAGPRIQMTAADLALCALSDDAGPLVQGCIDPRKFVTTEVGATLAGRIRGSGRRMAATSSHVGRNESNVLLGSMPAFVMTGNDANLRSDNVQFPASFSWVSVAYYFAHKTSPAAMKLLYLHDPVANVQRAQLATLSNGNLVFGGAVTSLAEAAVIPYASLPGDSAPFVVAGVYDGTSQKARIYLNGTTIKDESDGTVSILPAATDRLGLGGMAGVTTSYGWNGRLGKSYLFRAALSEAQVATVIAALRAEYGF